MTRLLISPKRKPSKGVLNTKALIKERHTISAPRQISPLSKANPSKYVPQYGGFFANGVKNNNLKDADPRVFFILKGKLYLCESRAAEKKFCPHEDEDIVKTNKNWYQLHGYAPPTPIFGCHSMKAFLARPTLSCRW